MSSHKVVIGSIFLMPIVIITLLRAGSSPDQEVLGEWREVAWEYEKLDTKHADPDWIEDIDDHVKAEIYNHLIVHKAEIWEFLPDGDLILHGDRGDSIHLVWKLKGRGNVMELDHESKDIELYYIQELSPDRLVLNFNTDLQVRGIVKMTFERIHKQHAAKKG